MCGMLSVRPARSEAGIQRRIAGFILLHEALGVLAPLAEALAPARSEVLQARHWKEARGSRLRPVLQSAVHG